MPVRLVQRAYKTELDLNDRQVTACKQHAGAARWAYNWGLQVKQERYRTSTKSPNAIALHRELNALKQTAVPWMYQRLQMCPTRSVVEPGCRLYPLLPSVCAQEAGEVERHARVSAVQDQEEGAGQFPAHRPHCGVGQGDCAAATGRLPLKERGYLPTAGVQILSATVSEQAGHWYVSVQVEEEQAVPENTGPMVGIDLGIKSLATLSDGEVIPEPSPRQTALEEAETTPTGGEPAAERREEPQESRP